MTVAREEAPADAQHAREAQAFRPNSRPVVIALAANVLLAALCLGLPYWRGQSHAKTALGAFSEFAACLYGGKPASSLGLGLPPRSDAWFASAFMTEGADWPARCTPPLARGTPPEAIFLWPSVKLAGVEVRAALALVAQELEDVGEARGIDGTRRVPTRTLAAVSKLRASLTLFARATNVDERLDDDALVFDGEPALAEPVRLPLYAGASAALAVRANADTVEATGLDGSGLSWLRVRERQIDRRRVARSSLVRGVLRSDHADDARDPRVYIVWAMPPEKCFERDDRCVRRAMGIAAFDPANPAGAAAQAALPEPLWLGAHPFARVDRVARLHAATSATELDLVALASPEGDAELRHFTLEPPPDPKAPPRAPFSQTPFPERPLDALLLEGAVFYASAGEGGLAATLWPYRTDGTASGAPRPLGTLAGTHPWLASCEAVGARWLVAGSESEIRVARVVPDAEPVQLPAVALALGAPLHADDPAQDRIRLACEPTSLALFALDEHGALALVPCNAGGESDACAAPRALASDVAAFDVASLGDATVVATSGIQHPEVVVRRFDRAGTPLGPSVTPAVCWDPLGGMCGRPTLAASAERLLLVGRDGADLLVLASTDRGESWLSPRDLGGGADLVDTRAAMEQHRKRKGSE